MQTLTARSPPAGPLLARWGLGTSTLTRLYKMTYSAVSAEPLAGPVCCSISGRLNSMYVPAIVAVTPIAGMPFLELVGCTAYANVHALPPVELRWHVLPSESGTLPCQSSSAQQDQKLSGVSTIRLADALALSERF